MVKNSGGAKGSKGKQASRVAATKSTKSDVTRPDESEPRVPLELQQKCLNIFRDALSPEEQDSKIVQEVKMHLYNRDFSAAFGREEYLRVYTSRWSSSRALAYAQVFSDVQAHIFSEGADLVASQSPADDAFRVVCLGGGAGAELVGLAAWASMLPDSDSRWKVKATFLDIASWNSVVESLTNGVVTAPELSKYASAAAKEASRPLLLPGAFQSHFIQQDVLNWDEECLGSIVTPDTNLVTLMFTLNELYTISMPKTQQLLSQLTTSMAPGSFLLVVDSPGSYSKVSINGAEKKYPMQWLLDYTLLNASAKANAEAKWEKGVSDESRWFRLPQGLKYPIELENMRYQIHLYRRLADVEGG